MHNRLEYELHIGISVYFLYISQENPQTHKMRWVWI